MWGSSTVRTPPSATQLGGFPPPGSHPPRPWAMEAIEGKGRAHKHPGRSPRRNSWPNQRQPMPGARVHRGGGGGCTRALALRKPQAPSPQNEPNSTSPPAARWTYVAQSRACRGESNALLGWAGGHWGNQQFFLLVKNKVGH
jgi:hypothetical protein